MALSLLFSLYCLAVQGISVVWRDVKMWGLLKLCSMPVESLEIRQKEYMAIHFRESVLVLDGFDLYSKTRRHISLGQKIQSCFCESRGDCIACDPQALNCDSWSCCIARASGLLASRNFLAMVCRYLFICWYSSSRLKSRLFLGKRKLHFYARHLHLSKL